MNNLEQLPPSEISDELRKRVAQLSAVIDLKLKALKKAPEGTLNISECRGHPQYYHRTEVESTKGKYIAKEKRKLAQQLAQKDYDARVIKALKNEQGILETALFEMERAHIRGLDISKIFQSLSIHRRALITPVTLSDEQYVAAWSSQKYEGKPFQPDAPEYYTARGERVRSKSEVIIADTLARLNIPYRYEFPFTLNGGGRHGKITVHPDFLCLNLRTRREFLWEHFGLMDNPDYSRIAVQKLHTYAENSIFPGLNLIISTETSEQPLNTRLIEEMIKNYLK